MPRGACACPINACGPAPAAVFDTGASEPRGSGATPVQIPRWSLRATRVTSDAAPSLVLPRAPPAPAITRPPVRICASALSPPPPWRESASSPASMARRRSSLW